MLGQRKRGEEGPGDEGVKEGGDEGLDDEERVFLVGDPPDGAEDALTAARGRVRPGVVADDPRVPGGGGDEGDGDEDAGLVDVEGGLDRMSEEKEEEEGRQGVEQVSIE